MGERYNRDFALILAAGYSTRMGTCKATLPWHNGRSLLRYQAEEFLQAGFMPIIVLGTHNAHLQTDCPHGSRIVINQQGDRGKTSSILTGLQSLPQTVSTITISAVDQPRSTHVYMALLQAYRSKKALITIPCYREKLGHPILFSHQILPELEKIEEATFGLRQVIHKFYCQLHRIKFMTPEILIDLNTPAEYRLELQKSSRSELE
ncbi:nucleotidyltransferase family protein [Myxosarcina sp. GI1(2024)]